MSKRSIINRNRPEILERTERGWVGHFICGRDCLFRRNTLLELGKTRVVVSTVGALWSEMRQKFEEIGHNRHYETIAFMAKYQKPYWEADTLREVRFNSNWSIAKLARDSDLHANQMHEAVVAEVSEIMLAGKVKVVGEE